MTKLEKRALCGPTYQATKFYGIYIQREGQEFWIVDDNGGDKYYGVVKPSEEQVEVYRNSLMPYHRS